MHPLLIALLAMLGIPVVSGGMDLLKLAGESALLGPQKKFAKEMQAREAETLAMVSGRNVAHQNTMFKQMQDLQERDRAATREDEMLSMLNSQAMMGQQQAGQVAQTMATQPPPDAGSPMSFLDILRQ
jgi:hypothetical protein